MTKSPMLWGAALAFALGGAVAGNALGSSPITVKSSIDAVYRSHNDGVLPEQATAPAVLPNHYALVTRDRTVPVAELADRGLYSQARYRAAYASVDYQAARYVASDVPVVGPQSRYREDEKGLRIGDYSPQPQTGQAGLTIEEAPPSPLTLSAGPATVPPGGTAKLVDVAATLAMR